MNLTILAGERGVEEDVPGVRQAGDAPVGAVLTEHAAVLARVRVLPQLRQEGEVQQVHRLGHAGEGVSDDRLLRDRSGAAAGVRAG